MIGATQMGVAFVVGSHGGMLVGCSGFGVLAGAIATASEATAMASEEQKSESAIANNWDYDRGFADGIASNLKLKQERITELKQETERLQGDTDYADCVRRWWCKDHGAEPLPTDHPCPACLIAEVERLHTLEHDYAQSILDLNKALKEVERLKAHDGPREQLEEALKLKAARAEGRRERDSEVAQLEQRVCQLDTQHRHKHMEGYRAGLEEAAKLPCPGVGRRDIAFRELTPEEESYEQAWADYQAAIRAIDGGESET